MKQRKNAMATWLRAIGASVLVLGATCAAYAQNAIE